MSEKGFGSLFDNCALLFFIILFLLLFTNNRPWLRTAADEVE